MTSEAASDIKIELSDLNYLYYHILIGSICHHKLNATTTTPVQNALRDQRERYAHAGKKWGRRKKKSLMDGMGPHG